MISKNFVRLTVFVVVFASFECHKILFLPVTVKSRILAHAGIGKALVKQGHEAVILKHPSTKVPPQLKNSGIRFIGYNNGVDTHRFDRPNFTDYLKHLGKTGLLAELPNIIEIQRNECKDYLQNEALFEALVDEGFDFALVDSVFGLQCRFAIPHRLGIPYANLMSLPPLDQFRTTLQTMYITPTMPGLACEQATFLQQFSQFLVMTVITILTDLIQPMDLIREYTQDRPISNMQELKENVAVWFVDDDPVIGYPRQLPPNVIYLGSLSAEPAQDLAPDLQTFADSAIDGLIIVSFGGSMYADFPQHHINALIKALEMVELKSIIRLSKNTTVEKTIKIVDWLPQNDLLGHVNTRLFITHGGKGSINEAAYHGVPMICFPGHDEQWSNCQRLVHRGWGKALDRNQFTAAELRDAIVKVANDPEYRKKIRKASEILRSRRTSAGELGAYWINHVIKYGAHHLKPYSVTLSWYQILMWDVLAAILVVVVILTYLVAKCCGFCCRKCCARNGVEKEKRE